MKPKHLPRLWCALQGLLPLEACLAAQQGELAWPREPVASPAGARDSEPGRNRSRRSLQVAPAPAIGIAIRRTARELRGDGPR